MEDNKEFVANSIVELLEVLPQNQTICDNAVKAYAYINSPLHEKIMCSISGGADSDVMLDICYKCDSDKKIDYVYVDVGIEYAATRKHIKELEEKYGIEIKVAKPPRSIAQACKEKGQPFLNKTISEFIYRLQKHDFDFENDGEKSFEELIIKYPKCKSALQWWSNSNISQFNIKHNAWLKEFMLQNPPTFKISQKCCQYAKKDLFTKILKDGEYNLNIMGVRKAEGGARTQAYKSCFDEKTSGCNNYRPLFYYQDKDKQEYMDALGIVNSDCYTVYGLKRTGCVCCPFSRNLQEEMEITEKFEPKLFKAVNLIFKDSYAYTEEYKKFAKEMNEKYGSYTAYLKTKEI